MSDDALENQPAGYGQPGCGARRPRTAAVRSASTARCPVPGSSGRFRSENILYSSTLREHPTARRSRSCSRSCCVPADSDAEYDAWLIDIFKGDQFGSGFVRSTQLQDPGAGGSIDGPAHTSVRERLDTCLSRGAVRCVSADRTPRASRNVQLADVADGIGALRWRRPRPLLPLRAVQNRVRDRSLRDGNQTSATRSGHAPGVSRVPGRQRIHDRRYVRSGPGTQAVSTVYMGRRSSCR